MSLAFLLLRLKTVKLTKCARGDLLTHRSGLGNNTDVKGVHRWSCLLYPTPEYQYSGVGYNLLQIYVVLVAAKSLDELHLEHFGDIMPQSNYSKYLPKDISLSAGHGIKGEIDGHRKIQADSYASAALNSGFYT